MLLNGQIRHGKKHRVMVKKFTRQPRQVFPNGVIYDNGDVEFWSPPCVPSKLPRDTMRLLELQQRKYQRMADDAPVGSARKQAMQQIADEMRRSMTC